MKKFVYTSSALLVAILLTLLIMGIFVKEVHFAATTRVHAPVTDSWWTFMDPSRQEPWQQDLESIETIQGQPMDPRASFRMKFANGPDRLETITLILPMQEYRANIETSSYSGYRSVTFQELGDGSRIQQTMVMRGSSFISRSLMPVIRPLLQRDQMTALDHLADLIEFSPSVAPTTHE